MLTLETPPLHYMTLHPTTRIYLTIKAAHYTTLHTTQLYTDKQTVESLFGTTLHYIKIVLPLQLITTQNKK